MCLQASLETRWWQHRSAHLGGGQLLELTAGLVSINDLQLTPHPSHPCSLYKYPIGIMTACHPLFHTRSPLSQPKHTSDMWLDAKLMLTLFVFGLLCIFVCNRYAHSSPLHAHISAQVIVKLHQWESDCPIVLPEPCQMQIIINR